LVSIATAKFLLEGKKVPWKVNVLFLGQMEAAAAVQVKNVTK
jgi:hypothetical protein